MLLRWDVLRPLFLGPLDIPDPELGNHIYLPTLPTLPIPEANYRVMETCILQACYLLSNRRYGKPTAATGMTDKNYSHRRFGCCDISASDCEILHLLDYTSSL